MEEYRPEQPFINPNTEPSPEHLGESSEQEPETIVTPELSSEQAAVDSLLGIDPQEMKDPMTFWSSFADLDMSDKNDQSKGYAIGGTYRGLKLDIGSSVSYPTGAMGGFRVDRFYHVAVDGRQLDSANAKVVAEHFRHILNAREKFLGLIHRT